MEPAEGADSQNPRRPVPAKTSAFSGHYSRNELAAMGKALRDKCPRNSHAEWRPPSGRPDPVVLIERADEGRIAELAPVRHGRMMQSPFAFFRGAALNMAADLASTPTTDVYVQTCGDAHLLNFRGIDTPERRVIFDIHDLDETLPAPWEWDVKRLAVSFVLACRDNGLGDVSGANAARACARSYREHMIEYAKMRALDVWNASVDAAGLQAGLRDEEVRRRLLKKGARVRERERSAFEDDFPKLAQRVKGEPSIQDNPPAIFHWRGDAGRDEFLSEVRDCFAFYRESLPPPARTLLDRFELKDISVKVDGVGSVGTFCAVILLVDAANAPLFLQLKEARASVLETYAGESLFANHGERLVNGHRLMQSADDIFLGWGTGKGGRHFYMRQLRDSKLKPKLDQLSSTDMLQFGEWCGWTLARSHARSGEPVVIGEYLHGADTFDKAIAAFSIAYANQTERDYEVFRQAVRRGDLKAAAER
jgi:uncharacterized protein (DUF2252 family)